MTSSVWATNVCARSPDINTDIHDGLLNLFETDKGVHQKRRYIKINTNIRKCNINNNNKSEKGWNSPQCVQTYLTEIRLK